VHGRVIFFVLCMSKVVLTWNAWVHAEYSGAMVSSVVDGFVAEMVVADAVGDCALV
jgi:hypothetical protein